tara:strand:- start:1667 stop:1984 length:318 start_codon:yes stop_codon:yes gene_type:complete
MDFKNYKYVIPIILIIVVSFLLSVFLINYFKIDINDNSGLIKLNKVAIYERFKNGSNPNNDEDSGVDKYSPTAENKSKQEPLDENDVKAYDAFTNSVQNFRKNKN